MVQQRMSDELRALAHLCRGDHLTLKQVIDHIDTRAQSLITLFLSLPFVFFLSVPGLSIIFGVFILFNGYRIAANKHVWVPKFLLKRKISGSLLAKCFVTAERFFKFAEKFVRPRGHFLILHPGLVRLNGGILAACGFFLALPLPPGTNFFPALTCVFLSIGILEKDGLFVVLGYIFFGLTLAFFTLLPIFGIEELKAMFHR
jgi:hypothetical protein